jgi:prepilin-type N-terminal cleavage/methylation domain-containing protein
MRAHSQPGRAGTSLAEMLVVMVLVGICLSIAVPRVRVSQATRVKAAADQLVRDLEIARSRALATRSMTRVAVNTVAGTYVGYLDDDRNGVLAQTAAETAALEAYRSRSIDSDVRFGRGAAPDLPGYAGGGSITLPNSRVDFDTRGLTTPLGTKGVIYLWSATDPNAVAAVSVSGAAAIRAWVYQQGVWQ